MTPTPLFTKNYVVNCHQFSVLAIGGRISTECIVIVVYPLPMGREFYWNDHCLPGINSEILCWILMLLHLSWLTNVSAHVSSQLDKKGLVSTNLSRITWDTGEQFLIFAHELASFHESRQQWTPTVSHEVSSFFMWMAILSFFFYCMNSLIKLRSGIYFV